MAGKFYRCQTEHLNSVCKLLPVCINRLLFFQGDMGPAGSIGLTGPQVYILLGYMYMLQLFNFLEMFGHCVWFKMYYLPFLSTRGLQV